MTNQTAASPSERAVKAAREWRVREIGHFMDSAELGPGGEDKLVDESLAALLDSFARVEVLRGRDREARYWVMQMDKRGERFDLGAEEAYHIADLQAQLKEAEEGR